jgi:hypothetical protein
MELVLAERHSIQIVFFPLAFEVPTTKASSRSRPKKAQVRLLASKRLVRGTWGLNENTYLAELTIAHVSQHLWVGMINACPNEAPPLPGGQLTSSLRIVLPFDAIHGVIDHIDNWFYG